MDLLNGTNSLFPTAAVVCRLEPSIKATFTAWRTNRRRPGSESRCTAALRQSQLKLNRGRTGQHWGPAPATLPRRLSHQQPGYFGHGCLFLAQVFWSCQRWRSPKKKGSIGLLSLPRRNRYLTSGIRGRGCRNFAQFKQRDAFEGGLPANTWASAKKMDLNFYSDLTDGTGQHDDDPQFLDPRSFNGFDSDSKVILNSPNSSHSHVF